MSGKRLLVLLIKNPAGANEAVRTLLEGASPSVVLVALNGQVRWQNERYVMPAVAWMLIMTALGGEVHYSEYPGVGHNSWDNAYAEPDLMTWMLGKTTSARASK